MNLFSRTFLAWLPLAIAVTGMCFLVYATVQQNYRQTLNDPQIQMAEDAAALLDTGTSPASLVPRDPLVDLRASLAPWLAVYDSSGKPLEASAQLDNAPPQLPAGVFDTTQWSRPKKAHLPSWLVPQNEDRITWQPAPDVRQAIVIVHAKNGMFVVAGRNMREVENREADLTWMVGLAWLVTMATTLVATCLAAYLWRRG